MLILLFSMTIIIFFLLLFFHGLYNINSIIPQIKNSDLNKFGIKKIYPSKMNGEEWYINMDNPVDDKRFDPFNIVFNKNQTSVFKFEINNDSSWSIIPLTSYTYVRMNVLTSSGYDRNQIATFNHSILAKKGYMQSPNDWKNIEMTGYIKLNQFNIEEDEGILQWYSRGGIHYSNNGSSNQSCEGVGYKGNLFFNGDVRFAKEQWHVSYEFTDKKSNVTSSLKDRWIGFKYITYNIKDKNTNTENVKLEIWLDKKANNKWTQVYQYIDNGNWGKMGIKCGGNKDQIITWGGPIATFRWDNATDIDFKFLSIREIQPSEL